MESSSKSEIRPQVGGLDIGVVWVDTPVRGEAASLFRIVAQLGIVCKKVTDR